MMTKITKIVTTIILIASILFMSWISISWVDIVTDNLKDTPQHHEWNFFVKMTDTN